MKFEHGTTTIAFDESRFKYCCDLKNSLDTAREEGEIKGYLEGRIEIQNRMAAAMIESGEPMKTIIKYTGLPIDKIEVLRNKIK